MHGGCRAEQRLRRQIEGMGAPRKTTPSLQRCRNFSLVKVADVRRQVLCISCAQSFDVPKGREILALIFAPLTLFFNSFEVMYRYAARRFGASDDL